MYKTLKALVLRSVRYKEADAILTLLTDSDGKFTVSAHGVLGKSGRLSAACQLLTLSDMTLAESHGRMYVKEAQTIEQFLGLRQDIAALALGTYFAELLERVSDEDSPNAEMLSLGLNSLYALSNKIFPPLQIKSVFELRLMCLAGYEPRLEFCPVCGDAEIDRAVFSTLGGAALCGKCAGSGFGETFPLPDAALKAMRHIVNADGKKAFSFSIDPEALKRLSDACEAYVRAQLEQSFSSLDYWKKVR